MSDANHDVWFGFAGSNWADFIDYSAYMIMELWAFADTVHVTKATRKSWGGKIGLKSALNMSNRLRQFIERVCVCDVIGEMMPCGFSHLSAILHKWISVGNSIATSWSRLSGCQRTKCNWNVLDDRTNLLCCSLVRCIRNAKHSHRMSDSLFSAVHCR